MNREDGGGGWEMGHFARVRCGIAVVLQDWMGLTAPPPRIKGQREKEVDTVS